MLASIYKITAPNGKSYIGQNLPGVHAKLKAKPGRVSLSLKLYGLKDRMKQHRAKNSRCTLLRRSIKKYGWENMKVEVLLQCAQEHVNDYEQQMIKAWDTLAPNGLNCTTGGEAGKRLSIETRQNISKALKGYFENHANPQKGLTGRKHTEETKQKLSRILKGNPRLSTKKKTNSEDKEEKTYKKNGRFSDQYLDKLRKGAQGCVGIHKATGKYQAIIPKSWNNGKQKFIGRFITQEEAWAAIEEYKAEHVDS